METAFLWLDIDAPAITPPTVTREQTLPLGKLTWENFERLCFRLAHRGGDVEDARIYGERGQAQEGIDLYVRRDTGDYATWQCKRYQALTAVDIKNAVTKFLEGDWAKRSKLFRLAVAPSLNAIDLAEEIEQQRVRCEAFNIAFEVLDRYRISLMLKDHPDLVDDFFGRAWVEAFNGVDAAASLSGRKLSREQKVNARRCILDLYSTHFQTVDGGIPAAAPAFHGAVKRVPVFDRYVEPSIELVESVIEQGQRSTADSEDNGDNSSRRAQATGFRRREIRTRLSFSNGLATSDHFLLLGGAGFGKSAALRVVIHSLLSNETRFPDIAKVWGQRLPLLLPFAFLTRHFAENEEAPIESALNLWLKVLGAKDDILKLLEEMLADERLLLLVDGLDEWQNREAAVAALTALTSYVQTLQLPLIATSRPSGFEQISDIGPDWKRGYLLPLSPAQQREFATYWFRHFHEAEAALGTMALEQAVMRDATAFAAEVSDDPSLSALSSVPLLLSVMIYLRLTGRVLPHSRLAAIEEIVKALLEGQPQRRAQAAMQRAERSVARSPRIRRGIEYLAYRIHQEPNSLFLSNERTVELLDNYFRSDLELSPNEADEWANRVLEIGQHEFGVLVAPQEGCVGFSHRIFQEYLAARYLARLSFDRVKNYCVVSGRKTPWHEVTLMLVQLLERQEDVDEVIDELRKPVDDCLDEPPQQILLTRLAVVESNCSRSKARELISMVFSWIECGRWMPLRRSLVQEVIVGLESEQVGTLVAARIARWFPGRVRSLYNIPTAAARQPTNETVSDLRIALYNCESGSDYRRIAEALASFAETFPELVDEFLAILKGPAEPELMGASLLALAAGWPTHPVLPSLLESASVSPAKELRRVAILSRFRRGDRSNDVREALVSFCREGEWPREDDVVSALATGWPHDSELKRGALERVRGIGFPLSWAPKPAIDYLLQGCPGDDDVARMVADQLALGDRSHRKLLVSDVHQELLKGFTAHPLLVSAAEAWLDNNASTHHSPLETAVVARLGGTPKCRQALIEWLRRGQAMPAWIISTLLEMSEPDDSEVQAVLAEYISDEQRRAAAVRWLPMIVHDPRELGVMLRNILRDAHVFDSCSALAILVSREGRDAPDLWSLVEARIVNDKGGHYWRLGRDTILNIWPEHPLIRQLVKSTVYDEDISISALYQAYGTDPEMRPLLDGSMRVLHEDLRIEIARSIEPLVRRSVPAAVEIAAGFRNEPNGEARTLAARAYVRACIHTASQADEFVRSLDTDLVRFGMADTQRWQALVAALLELGRADLIPSL